jgi:hypothetical protein
MSALLVSGKEDGEVIPSVQKPNGMGRRLRWSMRWQWVVNVVVNMMNMMNVAVYLEIVG